MNERGVGGVRGNTGPQVCKYVHSLGSVFFSGSIVAFLGPRISRIFVE